MQVRSPAVAGRFYPADPVRLRRELDTYLGTDPVEPEAPKAIIAPHAGYPYSGPVAGTVYAQLLGADHITRVVLLGPAHTVALRGMAITGADAWDTPLGRVPIDIAARELLVLRHPWLGVDDTPHRSEHALEVHLPFLQETLDEFALLPIVVGETSASEVAALLDDVWGGNETLIVISTDLSHYLEHGVATRRDRATCAHIADGDETTIGRGDACGYFPLRGFLVAARHHGLRLELLDRRTSADTAGDPDRVVGYAAFRADDPRSEHHGRQSRDESSSDSDLAALPSVAADAIAAKLRGETAPDLDHVPTALTAPGAAFVSLHRDGRLLGCIGTLDARRPLAVEVADKAVAAAFDDPRLPPITAADFEQMEIEVSVLTPSVVLDVDSYDALVGAVRPGDGITVQAGRHRATLLPSVWHQDRDTEGFLAALWHKAGLRPREWPGGIRIERYGSVEVTDPGPRPPP
ncbi:MAG TPA: AmmeMemoRadiSam system protein B [Acidimicrobiales bacterium]|nr:AmmeMemoRadiSam system protein B [Acidimicrobiales bacterium]